MFVVKGNMPRRSLVHRRAPTERRLKASVTHSDPPDAWLSLTLLNRQRVTDRNPRFEDDDPRTWTTRYGRFDRGPKTIVETQWRSLKWLAAR